MQMTGDNWAEGSAYDAYMGRWSGAVAKKFIDWLDPEPGLRWLDIGCGTGALSKVIIQTTEPESVIGCDPSEPFIAYASAQPHDPRLSFLAATLENLPQVANGFGTIVSGLVLNFTPDPVGAVRLMMGRARQGGLVAAYVWDYAGRMDFLRSFWDAAGSLDPAARTLDEGMRFPLCTPVRLESTFREAGLSGIRTTALDIETIFSSFSDYWQPFLSGTGPAPNYVTSLSTRRRNLLTAALKQRLESPGGGKIEMMARAWAVRGNRGKI